jgi:hypothetical protein
MNLSRNILMASLLLVCTHCIASLPLLQPTISIYQASPMTLSNQQAQELVRSCIPNLNHYQYLTIQKHDGYLIIILQEKSNSPIQISRVDYDANYQITSFIGNYAAVRDPINYALTSNHVATDAHEKLLLIAVNANMHVDEVADIQKIYDLAISSGYATNHTITILADDVSKPALQQVVPDANFESASLENMQALLLSPELSSIFYYGDGFPNAFSLGSGDFITAQDFQALIDDKTHPFTFANKTFIANACDAFLSPMGDTIVVQGHADAYLAGITAISPQGIAVQLFMNYVLKNERPFQQAFEDAQDTVGITDYAENMVSHGIYGMAGTQISNLFPSVSAADQSLATIEPLSSDEPFQVNYTFQKPSDILGYTLVSIDLGHVSPDFTPGFIFTLPLQMPIVMDPSHNFSTTSPANFTTYSFNHQGHTIYMIGDFSEIFALNRVTGSPASEVIYKDNDNDPTSMPQIIDYKEPWWNDYYHTI